MLPQLQRANAHRAEKEDVPSTANTPAMSSPARNLMMPAARARQCAVRCVVQRQEYALAIAQRGVSM